MINPDYAELKEEWRKIEDEFKERLEAVEKWIREVFEDKEQLPVAQPLEQHDGPFKYRSDLKATYCETCGYSTSYINKTGQSCKPLAQQPNEESLFEKFNAYSGHLIHSTKPNAHYVPCHQVAVDLANIAAAHYESKIKEAEALHKKHLEIANDIAFNAGKKAERGHLQSKFNFWHATTWQNKIEFTVDNLNDVLFSDTGKG